eukprot:gene9638-9715_t
MHSREPLRADLFARAAIKSVLARKLPVSTTTYLRIALYQALIGECRRYQASEQLDIARTGPQSSQSPILNGLSRLSQDERDVIVLVAIEQCSHADAASVLDLPVFALVARLTRAREHLQAEIGRQHMQSHGYPRRNMFLRLDCDPALQARVKDYLDTHPEAADRVADWTMQNEALRQIFPTPAPVRQKNAEAAQKSSPSGHMLRHLTLILAFLLGVSVTIIVISGLALGHADNNPIRSIFHSIFFRG